MNQTLKQKTLKQFSGNWLAAILIALPTLLINVISLFLPYAISNLLTILSLFPIVGMYYTYLIWFRSGKVPAAPFQSSIKNVFATPQSFGPFSVAFLANVLAGLWTLLFIIPGVIKVLAYSQSFFIYKDEVDAGNENPKPMDCITKSREMMNGHKAELFTLYLSFFGWFILSLCTLGIGFIWLTPYCSGTLVNYYDELKNNTNN